MSRGQRFLFLLATGFGAGRAPLVPGTFGTLAAIPLHLLAAWLLTPFQFILMTLLFIPLAVMAADFAAREIEAKDPGMIVVDEWAGYLVTVAGAPLGWKTVSAGFVLFRLFDILKPFPARRLEALRGGYGIVFDDLMAGLYAAMGLRLFLYLF
ncbi:MAG: phosphatidylglycerophosphatase A [Acidobacteriota bacterium]